MTVAEVRAYNRGVADVLAIARRSADVLASSTTRPLAEGFAIEALRELAEAGAALLLPGPVAQLVAEEGRATHG